MVKNTDRIAQRMLEIYADDSRWRHKRAFQREPVGCGHSPMAAADAKVDIRGCTIIAAADLKLNYMDAGDTYAMITRACWDLGFGKSVDDFNYDPSTSIEKVRELITAIISTDLAQHSSDNSEIKKEEPDAHEEFSADLFPATPEIPINKMYNYK